MWVITKDEFSDSDFPGHRVVGLEALPSTTGQLLPYPPSDEGGPMCYPFPSPNPSVLREFPEDLLGKELVGSPRDFQGYPEETRGAIYRDVSRLACQCTPPKPSTIETAALALNDTPIHQ